MAACLLLASSVLAESLAITNARIVPVNGPVIEKGTVLVTDGRITAVGARVPLPKNVRRIDGSGYSLYPGWVHAFGALGLAELSSVRATVDAVEAAPFNPAAEAWVAVNPHSGRIRVARSYGVTTAVAAPARNQIAGVASVMNLEGPYPARMALLKQAGLVVELPSLQRPGPPPEGSAPPLSQQERKKRHAEQMTRLKRFLRESQTYSEMRARGGPASDSTLEAMLPFVRGERPVIALASHFREIREAVAFADEFKLRLLIAGATDAWKVAELLKEKNVGVLYGGVHMLPQSSNDAYDTGFSAPAALHKAGVRFALVSAYEAVYGAGDLPWLAATATAYSLSPDDAIKAITLWPAELLGVAKDVGSIEEGKLANLVLWKGDPLDIRSQIHRVFIGGKEVPLESRHTQLYREFRQDTTR
jgi:imidazolonepropionase-like amidohydrolase